LPDTSYVAKRQPPVITDAVDDLNQQFAAMWLSRRIAGRAEN
jgi:hypothetical protein